MKSLLFAYGTLTPRDPSTAAEEGWLPDAVRGTLYDLGPYPALIDLDGPDAGWVLGYVRSVSPEELKSFDAWEDVDNGPYQRVETSTREQRRVWVYVYAQPLPAGARGPLSAWQPQRSTGSRQLVAFGEGDDHGENLAQEHRATRI